MTTTDPRRVLAGLQDLLPTLEDVYKDLHAHPELSMQEHRTSGIAANHLEKNGFHVTRQVGQTGVVGVLENGHGPVIMLRADMDGLPIKESTGLDYASTVIGDTPAAHACGHDMHVTWLMGASQLFASCRDAWSGTLIVLFQPGEEKAEGAKAMLEDGLHDKVLERYGRPEVVLGQHVMVGPAGTVASTAGGGPITFAADSLEIRLFGKGAHGSMPQSSIDPVVMAASIVLRLQTIVSRELSSTDSAVITVGSLQAGDGKTSNVIPAEAVLQVNVRTLDEGVRKRVLDAIERIIKAEATASGATKTPTITTTERYPLNVNDGNASERVGQAMKGYFDHERVRDTGPNPDTYQKAKSEGRVHELPVNHSPAFAPVLHPTLETGVEAMVTAAMSWLGKAKGS